MYGFRVDSCQNLQQRSMRFILAYHDSYINGIESQRIILTYKSRREQNAFHVAHIPSILSLQNRGIFTRNLVT